MAVTGAIDMGTRKSHDTGTTQVAAAIVEKASGTDHETALEYGRAINGAAFVAAGMGIKEPAYVPRYGYEPSAGFLAPENATITPPATPGLENATRNYFGHGETITPPVTPGPENATRNYFGQGETVTPPVTPAPKTIANPGIQWGKGIAQQGMPWEDYLAKQMPGNRLPPKFKTFDFFDEESGLATSAKTLDTLTEAKLANPKQIYNSLVRDIDAAIDFDEYQRMGRTVKASDIGAREIQLAVPEDTTSAQWEQINKAIEYGTDNGVSVRVTVVK
jgi:hypothetical protein